MGFSTPPPGPVNVLIKPVKVDVLYDCVNQFLHSTPLDRSA